MTKRLLPVLVCLSMALAVFAAYDEAEYNEKREYADAAAKAGWTMEVSDQQTTDDPAVFMSILESAATQSGVNVLRKADGFDLENEPFVAYYAYVATDKTRLFDSLRLREGRFPTAEETRRGEFYLSSRSSDDPSQIGVIDDIGRDDRYYVYGLVRAFDSYKTSGTYHLESSSPQAVQEFYRLFREGFEALGVSVEVEEGFDGTVGHPALWGHEEGFAEQASLFAAAATIVLIFYRQICESKRAAVLLLYGNGYLRAWYLSSGRGVLLASTVGAAASTLAVLLVPGLTLWLVVGAIGKTLGMALLFAAASLSTVLLIRRMSIQEALKNRKDTLVLAVGNLAVKGVLSLVLVYTGAVTVGQLQSADRERERWGDWRQTSQYGMFYPCSVGLDGMAEGTSRLESVVFDLYPVFNADGSLYVDALNFAYYAIGDGQPGYRSMVVNPNYLAAYPVRAADGSHVSVSEDETDWVLLVPESLKAEESEIREFFEPQRGSDEQSMWAFDESVFGRTVENPKPDQVVRIVWTEPGQRVFSFSPEVFPEDGNCVVDPIIQVMTMANSSGMDRQACVLGGMGDALKVRLDAGGCASTYDRYLPLLRAHALDDNMRQLVTVDEAVLSIVKGYDEAVAQYALQMVLVFAVLLVLVLQSVPLVFELGARKTAVKKLHGYPFFSRNRFFFCVLLANWAALFCAVGVFNSVLGWPFGEYGSQNPLVLYAVAGAFFALEAAISATVLSAVERRRVVDVLKEGS